MCPLQSWSQTLHRFRLLPREIASFFFCRNREWTNCVASSTSDVLGIDRIAYEGLGEPLEKVLDFQLDSACCRLLARAAIKLRRPSWTFSHPILVLSTMAPSTGSTASTSALPQPLASTPLEAGATGSATDRPELAMRSAAGTSSGSEPLHSSAADDAPVGLASQDTAVGDDPHTVDTILEHVHSTSRDSFASFWNRDIEQHECKERQSLTLGTLCSHSQKQSAGRPLCVRAP